MSHPEQSLFVSTVIRKNPQAIREKRILDIGSYDVDGNMRRMFHSAHEFIGIDLTDGPNVDYVISGHEISKSKLGSFDVVLSLEALEHDPQWRLTVHNALAVLDDPGVFIVSCASFRRPEHGTSRTTPGESPGTISKNWDHYENIHKQDFVDYVKSTDERLLVHAWYNSSIFDLYAIVVKDKHHTLGFEIPNDDEILRIQRTTPLIYRAARIPIKVAYRIGGSAIGAAFSRNYWSFLSNQMSKFVRGTRGQITSQEA